MSLTAHRRLLEGPPDPRWRWLAARQGVVHHDRDGLLLGVGALRPLGSLRLGDAASRREVIEQLGAITLDGDEGPLGTDPRCHVALPFDPNEAATPLVPALQILATREGTWLTAIGEDPRASLDAASSLLDEVIPPAPTWPSITELSEHPSPDGYGDAVAAALESIAAHRVRKVVLARSSSLVLDDQLDPAGALERLHEREPSCTAFALPAATARFVGASPELLMDRRGDELSSHPLAGTRALDDGDHVAAELTASTKDLEEHRYVVDAISAELTDRCTQLHVPEAPALVVLRSVAHLGTSISGTVEPDDPRAHVLELLAAIHPTPAIAGVPRIEAMEEIRRLEGAPRGLFGGAIGWFDAAGDGSFVLGIRGALLEGSRLEVSAGAGIVEGSTPRGEAAETRAKLASILDALVPGGSALLGSAQP